MDERIRQSLRRIPSISALLESSVVQSVAREVRPDILTALARKRQEVARSRVMDSDLNAAESVVEDLVSDIENLVRPATREIINGTGIIVHTNLGRAPVSRQTADAMREAAMSNVALEVDPESGRRGGRGREVASLLQALTGCEDALIVNNNAAAITLTLSALAFGKPVIVSRGEAVEIGGGFRIPDVLRQSGCTLVEVGTTNRTYLDDYSAAVNDQTAALMKIHASNFAVVGFTSQPSIDEISGLARRHGIYAIEDAGSGCLVDTAQYGLGPEPLLQYSIAAGANVVTASGDKLLGGPQAGIILGDGDSIGRIRRHPLARAVRVDKTVQAGIAATLRHYIRGDYEQKVPVWWSISQSVDTLEDRVRSWIDAIGHPALELVPSEAAVGGGALPGKVLPSRALVLRHPSRSPDEVGRALRTGDVSLFPRIVDDGILVDARTVLPNQDEDLIAAIKTQLG